jgi:GAF domain-containing protein
MASDALDALSREELIERLRAAEALVVDLQRGSDDGGFAAALRQALIQLGVIGYLAAPTDESALLNALVGTARQVLRARAAALFLVDHEAQEMVFEVVLGREAAAADPARALRHLRVPLGTGIAGWVAISGQPVARADAASDPRFARDFAERIGYTPQTVLCVPLRGRDRVVGVLELFDKADGEPFTPDDMQLLEQFGVAAAVALEQARLVDDLADLFAVVLRGLVRDDGNAAELARALDARGRDFAARAASSDQYRGVLEISRLVGQISREGPEAVAACRAVLDGLAGYVESQARRDPFAGRLP